MKGFMCFTQAKNNEEFKVILKRRGWMFLGISIIGLLTILAVVLAAGVFQVEMNDHTAGLLSGMGTGLLAAGLILFLRNQQIRKDESRIKKERLACTDEREIAIAAKALKCGTIVAFVALYATGIYGAIASPEMIKPVLITGWAFVIAYAVARKVYQKKM